MIKYIKESSVLEILICVVIVGLIISLVVAGISQKNHRTGYKITYSHGSNPRTIYMQKVSYTDDGCVIATREDGETIKICGSYAVEKVD